MLEKIFLGTYTRRKSEGIYTILLDTEKAELSGLTLVAKETSPTYLARSQKNFTYAVTSVDGKGGAASYDPSFKLVNQVTEEGAPLCYVAVDEDRQLVYGANYHKGEVNVYQILADGSLKVTDALYHEEPVGPHENQDHAHVHYANLTPDNRLAVCDLGTDRVYLYLVSKEGKLTETNVYKAPDATGPRHLVFHRNDQYAYLVGELDSSITVLAYDRATGTFKEKQKVFTIPEDFDDFNSGAAIRVTQDDRFLYASNRGHNSIAVFAISEDGAHLDFVQLISSEGDFPRDFALNPTENYLVCAHQNSDNLTLYTRDQETGKLTCVQKDVYAPECVCVLFE